MAFKYTEDQLNKMDKTLLVELFLGLQDQMEELTKETHALNDKMQLMMEQLILSKHQRFRRSTERMDDSSQISFMEIDGKIVFFNEAEAVYDPDLEEPEDLKVKKMTRKKRGKKDHDLEELPVNRIDHYLTEEELTSEFGKDGWKQLPDTISRQYHFVPAKVEVEEHHIGVYASKKDEHMIRAPYPKSLLHGSLVSPSLGAAIIYSIAETAKANDLKPYEYFEYLLTEIPKHMEDTDLSFLEELLPWSETLPGKIRKSKKDKQEIIKK